MTNPTTIPSPQTIFYCDECQHSRRKWTVRGRVWVCENPPWRDPACLVDRRKRMLCDALRSGFGSNCPNFAPATEEAKRKMTLVALANRQEQAENGKDNTPIRGGSAKARPTSR